MTEKKGVKKNFLYFYIGIISLSIAVYANTFNHDFALDDDVVFLQNRFVQEGVSAIPDILSHGFLFGYNQKNDQSYRPVVLINFAIEKSIVGNNPKALHKLNVFYYALLCCILFRFLNLLFLQQQPWIAFWITFLFVLHPIHTEVVANIKGRDDILHALFLILSFIHALKYIDSSRKKHLLLSLVTYFLALLCKEMAVTYVALLPLTVWVFREVKVKKIAELTAGVAVALLSYFILRTAILDTVAFDEKMSIINNGIAAAENLPDRLATTFLIFGNYIKLLFFPHPLAWDYSYPHFPIVSLGNPLVILIIISLVCVGVISLLKIKSKNKFAFSFLFFIISFSVVSNFFILIGSTLGERFLFFPSVAFCLFLVLLIQWLVSLPQRKNVKLLPSIILVIGALYAFKTIDRNQEWKNSETLFISGAKATPNNSRAISAIGSTYRELAEKSRNQQQQLEYYKQSIKNYKRSIELLPSNSDSHYNLGVVYMAIGKDNEAKKSFEVALQITPEHLNALNNLGVIYFREKNFAEAERLFLESLKIKPNFQNAIANLGAVYHNVGQLEKAKQYYLLALELNPNDLNSRRNLSKL